MHNLGQTHKRGPLTLDQEQNFSPRCDASASQRCSVITTTAAFFNCINRQTPVGGPITVRSLTCDNKSTSLSPSSTHTLTVCHTRVRALTYVQLNPHRPGLFRFGWPVNVVCECVYERETESEKPGPAFVVTCASLVSTFADDRIIVAEPSTDRSRFKVKVLHFEEAAQI